MLICSSGLSDTWIIAGIAAAAVVLVAVIIIAVVIAVRSGKKKRSGGAESVQGPDEEGASEGVPASYAEEQAPAVSADTSERISDEASVSEDETPSVTASEPEPDPVAETSAAPVIDDTADPAAAETADRLADKKPKPKPAGVRRAAGSWSVEYKREGEYIAVLCAKNGELMLESEIYTTEDGARAGISTIVKNITGDGKFVIYRDKNDNYYFKLKTSGNKLLCIGEIYRSKDQCEKAVESVRRLAAEAPVAGGVSKNDEYIEYRPAPVKASSKAAPGKWQIRRTDDGKYRAMLFAGNGQLMLATEEVSSQNTAMRALDAVRKNASDGNFVIDRDKFGRYCYKLRNAKKSVICTGETYDSLASCVKAIETVRRYCVTAELV